jgi:Zn-dependent peptidase ImmA (M78 family)
MREVADDERSGLGLGPTDRLDPYALSKEHGIDVYSIHSLSDSGCSPETVAHFTQDRVNVWSAALVPIGRARIIIENTAHAAVRRVSSIAHELGHHFLEHDFDGVLLNEDGCRSFDPQREKEADFLASQLLVPEVARRKMAFAGWDNSRVGKHFGVSEQYSQMCMKGVRVMAARALSKQSVQRPSP